MRTHNIKASLKAAVKVAGLLFFGAVAAFGQNQQVNVTVAPTTTTTPNGQTVPMWGYFCGTAVTGSTATCAASNPASVVAGVQTSWSPVVITVPSGQTLTVNLTNHLSFTPSGTTTPNNIPTSLTIVGQLGGGLGDVTQRTTTASPSHLGVASDTVTWATVGSQPGFTPPPQGPRVQSFGTEVTTGTTVALTFGTTANPLRPGTYLIESGTHPSIQGPMGLYGILVVTCPPGGAACGATPAGTAYPANMNGLGSSAITYNAEVNMVFSEIDPVQNKAVDTAVRTPGFSEINQPAFGDTVGTISVTGGGSGYSAATPPTVTIGAPCLVAAANPSCTGANATATATVGAVVSSIGVTTGGSGYTSAPAVTIADTAPGTGTGATATAVLGGGIGSITVTAPGSGYSAAAPPAVTISDCTVAPSGAPPTCATPPAAGTGGSGATAVAVVKSIISALTVTAPGSGYTAPTITITDLQGTGSGATATATLGAGGAIASFAVTNPGSGYVSPLVTITDTTGTGATATAVTSGAVYAITVTNPGANYTNPFVTIGGGVAPTPGTLAAASSTLGGTAGTVVAITVTNPGSGYTAPVVTIAPPTSGTAATATATTAGTPGVIYAVTLTSGGSGYRMAPSVTISAPASGTTATANASISQSCNSGASTTSGAAVVGQECYPAAVNYTPLYYMINGVAFNKTNALASVFPVTPAPAAGTATTGTVLVRAVNAGLRMHVPSIVGSTTTPPATYLAGLGQSPAPASLHGFQMVAEDGNPLPGTPKVQNEVLMVPGKVMDLLINAPAAGAAAIPMYDRELSLSAGSVGRDGGMLAYISVNGSTIAGYSAGAASGIFAAAHANPDTYNSVVAGQPLNVWDAGKGVIANDVNVYGVQVSVLPTHGTVVLNSNGTFIYTPDASWAAVAPAVATASDSFSYCANGAAAGTANLCTTVSLGGAAAEAANSLAAHNRTYTSNTSTYFALKAPGVLGTQYDTSAPPILPDTDANGYPLSLVVPAAATPVNPSCTGLAPNAPVVFDSEGGFTLSLTPPAAGAAPTATTCTFGYTVTDSRGTQASANVTVNFPVPSNLQVTVLDGYDKTTQITDYRWIIEEDRTYFVNPNCTTNVGNAAGAVTPPGCELQTGANSTNGVPPILGVNFHASDMPYVAIGCTGPLSCENGQMMYDNRPLCTTAPSVANPAGVPAGCSTTAGTHVAAICDLGDGNCRPDPNQAAPTGKTPVWPSSVPLDPSKRYYISVLPGDAGNPFGAAYGGSPAGCTTSNGNYAVGTCGHGMGGAPVPNACFPAAGANTCNTGTFAPVRVYSEPSPYPTAKLSVFVFEDDFPLNGEHDSSGGIGPVNTANEPGLGGFQIHMWDAFGASGDFTGQMSFDMFNQFLTNGLAGQIDPSTGLDACPIVGHPRSATTAANPTTLSTDPNATGMTGMIVTCPQFEADGSTPSPLAGQAVIENLMPGRWGVVAHPGADRIARGEEWLQTNTLDGQKAHDAFTKIGEPSYFQEFGPAGYHVSIGFANPAIINARHAGVCAGTDPNFPAGAINCNNTITGKVVGERLSRTPDERLYPSDSRDAFGWTQCYVSFGDPDGEDFAFTKCDADGNYTLTGLPDGDWRVTTFDQWNDQLVDGLSTPVRLSAGTSPANTVLNIAATQWQANIQTRTYIDDQNSGVSDPAETGIPFANVTVRYRDGQLGNWLTTDFNGTANFNETFPLFAWYTVETDTTRYKNTGIHVVYDVGGPADGSTSCGATGYPPCGNAPHVISNFLANTAEIVSVPLALRVPGAVYCEDADCSTRHMDTTTGGGPTASAAPSNCSQTTATSGAATGNAPTVTISCSPLLSSGRIDPPSVGVEGWQGFPGQFSFLEFGKRPYCAGSTCGTGIADAVKENGGIHGHVEYASTRPFDDPQMLVQVQWTPLVPNVTINLYKEGFATDGVTPTLTLVDTTKTSSWDDWAQGFRKDATGNVLKDASGASIPNMNCPGQGATATAANPNAPIPDLFFYSLFNQPVWLDYYNNVLHGTAASTQQLPNNAQFKCYDGMHNWNQVQPAPYDGMYQFPSITATNPATGRPVATSVPDTGNTSTWNGTAFTAGTNCTICQPNPDTTDHFRHGTPMLPSGKYVVEIVLPPGYELVKEEDKNILIGDNFIAPVTQQFGGIGNVFIVPDQATIASTYCGSCNPLSPAATAYNPTNPQQPTQSFGTTPQNQIVPAFIPEPVWPCVGEARVVPDYISLFPQTHQVSPFAGAVRNLCDRKEVTLQDQMSASAKFFIFTTTHIASKFYGGITDDYTSEFDPFSPTYGEKFSPPDMPVSVKDWTGTEISRVYADHWGQYNGVVFSTWEVNPPNPTGYAPGMMEMCMNDPGPVMDTRLTVLGPTGASIANPTYGKMVTDPLFQEGYSQFCYELPFMPGTTDYLDTPVVPTSAFAGVGYNNVDCSYPDATPAVAEVDGTGFGPWVSAAGAQLTINALGDQWVPNNAYAGPKNTTAPYNQKFIRRHYGFGSQAGVNGTSGSVTIGGVPATVNSWSDTQIVVTVPNGVSPCAVQQQAIYNGSAAQCGQLVINTSAARSGGNVTGVVITRGGNYNTAPTVTFGTAPAGGTTATGTAVLGSTHGVASVTVNPHGSGYATTPGVTFSGGGGTGATGTAVRRRYITGVTMTTNAANNCYPGAGPISVTFSNAGIGGTTATGTPIVSAITGCARHVTGVTITNGGSYATGSTPTVSFSLPATGGVRAFGSTGSTIGVFSVTVTAPGSGYTSAPAVVFTGGGGGTGASATATLSTASPVVSITLTNGGGSGYTSAPSVTFTGATAPGGPTALATATVGPSIVVSGKQSIDTVTVTIGGKAPTHVPATGSIQAAIDAAQPGDMIILDPSFTPSATAPAGTSCSGANTPAAPPAAGSTCVETTAAHQEMVIMWKPVRLQGVAAASSVINANAHPAGKLDTWRAKVDCLFGLGINGAPMSSGPTTAPNAGANPFDPTGAALCGSTQNPDGTTTAWTGFNPYDESQTTTVGGVAPFNPQVDRFPLEATVGWNADLNGNLAEILQEPSLMGALEGAGITVLAKGVVFPSDPYDNSLLAGFPTGTTLLQDTMSNPNGSRCLDASGTTNPYPSNFSCNPSSIDALGITDSSQGGGGVFLHGWTHNIQVANNRIYSNAGTLSGGINVGQGEFGPAYLQGGGALNAAPGSCEESPVPNAVLPYCQNVNVDIHNNYVSLNSSTGDELFSATPAGAGGVSICTGSDYYKFNYNWVCGNLSSGDGGGIAHLGFSYNGDIEHNTIIFNQSTNPTIPANGGGMLIAGTPDADLLCNIPNNKQLADQDCAPFGAPGGGPAGNNTAVTGVSPSDGVGPGLVINANLIMGNMAESGTGGGIAFQQVNGSDIVSFPTDPGQWNTVLVTNNIIANNVAGWDGGAISLYDSPNVNVINNTVAFNNSTGSAGILFNTLGAPLASQGGSNGATSQACNATAITTCAQIGGLVALEHSAVLRANMPASGVVCPPGHFQTTAVNGSCTAMSYPKMENNIFWKNKSYYIGVGSMSPQYQQNVVSLFNAFTGTMVAGQPSTDATAGNGTGTGVIITGGTGACASATSTSSIWDIGVRGDTGPANHGSTYTLRSTGSVLTPGGSSVLSNGGTANRTGNPDFISQYCNGSRVPPEAASAANNGGTAAAAFGWQVPPGIADATVPNPIFDLSTAATVDEGNNWVNVRYGPLTLTNPTVIAGANGNWGGGLPLGNYGITAGSAAVGASGGGQNFADAPAYDFFDAPRKTGGAGSVSAGAVQLGGAAGHSEFTISAALVDFGLVPDHSPTTLDQDIIVTNSDNIPITFANNGTINCSGGLANCSVASFTIQPNNAAAPASGSTCAGTTLAPGQSCVINVVFNPISNIVPAGATTGLRNANLVVTANGVSQTVLLTGHDTIAVMRIAPPGNPPGAAATIRGAGATTPSMVGAPAPNLAAVTGTVTITNILNPCLATPCPAGSNVDAGPFIPASITLTQLSGAGTFALGGTCAVGSPINAGGTAVPPVAGSSCTITITYTPPVGATAATPGLLGTAHLVVTGYGNSPVSNNTLIDAVYTAN